MGRKGDRHLQGESRRPASSGRNASSVKLVVLTEILLDNPPQINQSFDLSSLTSEHLDQARLDQLPALQELRDALYSSNFREWVQKVTGCGPLSQKKVDGSVSRYTKGCVVARDKN